MAGLLVPPFRLSTTSIIVPRSTSITTILGNTGGFNFFGGTATTDGLTIGANNTTFSDTNTGAITFKDRLLTTQTFTVASATLTSAVWGVSGTITSGIAINIYPVVNDSRVFRYSVSQNLSTSPTLVCNATFVPTVNGLSDVLSNFCGFLATPRYSVDVGVGNTATTGRLAGFVAGPIVANTTGTGTTTLLESFSSYNTAFFSTDIGAAVTTLIHYNSTTPTLSGAGAIVNHIVFSAGDLTLGSTLTASFRSSQTAGTGAWGAYLIGTANNMLRGSTIISPDTITQVPTNAVSLGGAAVKTIWMERHTTANTAGNNLTLQAGGATSAATDKAGGNLILAPGITTGTGRNQSILRGWTVATATGTSDNTALDLQFNGPFKTLTNNTVTALANFTLASNTVISGQAFYSVTVFNGTDLQIETGQIVFHTINKGGVFSGNVVTKIDNQQNATSGTLTVTFTVTGANPSVLSVNANSSLTPSAGYPRIRYMLLNNTEQAVAIQ